MVTIRRTHEWPRTGPGGNMAHGFRDFCLSEARENQVVSTLRASTETQLPWRTRWGSGSNAARDCLNSVSTVWFAFIPHQTVRKASQPSAIVLISPRVASGDGLSPDLCHLGRRNQPYPTGCHYLNHQQSLEKETRCHLIPSEPESDSFDAIQQAGGPSRSAVCAIEKGHDDSSDISGRALNRLASALKCNPLWLATGEGNVWPG
jgi:hypothetical protein